MTSDLMEVDSAPLKEPQFKEQSAVEELVQVCREISKATVTLDSRFVWKPLRELSVLRTKLNKETLSILVNLLYPDTSDFKVPLLKVINDNQKSHVEDADSFRGKYLSLIHI